VLPYLFVLVWLAVMFWEPLIVLTLLFLGQAPQAHLLDLFVCMGLSVLLWLIPYADMGIPKGLAFLYPFTILANEIVALFSLQQSLVGRLSWKGRTLIRPPWTWF
jgi:hypothetical protein